MRQVSESECNAATSVLTSYRESLLCHPKFRQGAELLFLLHPPDTNVHGTVVLLHGLTRLASASKHQAQYFFSRNFNAVALNLAGHHLSPDNWPSLTLRETAGYTAVRNALQTDTTIGPLIQVMNHADVFGPKEELFDAHTKTRRSYVHCLRQAEAIPRSGRL